jgi:FkbH-like protein
MDPMSQMPWLAAPPVDFRAQLKRAAGDATALRRLSLHHLDITQLGRLTDAIDLARAPLQRDGGYAELRLGILSPNTTDYIAAALPATALRHGLLLRCVTHDYGQVAQSVFAPNSPMIGQVDAVLLVLDAKMLGFDRGRIAEGAGDEAVESAVATVKGLAEGIRGNLRAACVFTTVPAPAEPLFGEIEARIAGTRRAMIERFNARLADELMVAGDMIVDVAQLANLVGLANWHDSRGWHASKLPFALSYTPLYADHICRVLAASRGKARKCLVLDLDNTVWGGIIGDDGLEGIKLGQGSATGEAHLELQAFALELRDRGIVLAVCSKNDEANALLPFSDHPEMILKKDHIAAFIANWSDKATNLREIAAMLNIGTDALVFLDDNPAERDIIRRELPEVAVPEAGDDPADYVAAIARAGYFEALAFSDEDRNRAEYYQANAERQSARVSMTNMHDYLLSLEMVATLVPFDAVSRARITQLTNKSNQFNLTTRRYTEADIARFESMADRFTVQVRLADRFGDNGIISVVMFDKQGEVWDCDTWLMSCRVLGRRVEEAVLAHVAEAALKEGAKRLRGTYLPTKKNGLVERHFEKLGFVEIEGPDTAGSAWELDLLQYSAPELPMALQGGA